jgi:hypothetical protein
MGAEKIAGGLPHALVRIKFVYYVKMYFPRYGAPGYMLPGEILNSSIGKVLFIQHLGAIPTCFGDFK